ncbi:GNAT family N-acetyltransferase [Lacinutrix chionoecetis]
MIVAETNRLIISKFTIEDAAFFMELVNTPSWLKYIGNRNINTIEQAQDRIKNSHLESYKKHGFGFYKLLLKAENLKPIGSTGIIKRPELEDVDIGFSLLPEYERMGFGFESANAVMALAKNEFNLKKICAITLESNKNSILLIEKLGLIFDKKVKPFENDKELLLFAKNL